MWTAVATDVPGDGNCMFHAVGVPMKKNADSLRKVVCDTIESNADSLVHGVSVRQWIEWDGSSSVEQYVRRMRTKMWGGAFELTLLSSILGIPLYVYSPDSGHKCKRIAEVLPDFELHAALRNSVKELRPEDVQGTPYISLLYVGKKHYMSLLLKKNK